jgi:endonuclease III-like uncharacterized protein
VNAAVKVNVIAQKAAHFGRRWSPAREGYPTEILDLIIFHKLHLSMGADDALKSFHQLKETFVDWNEVRISTVREIQEELASAGTLELAVFIKDMLEFVHRERQFVSLEFLAEKNLGEIRKYLKQVKGLDSSTVDLILRVRKSHPVFPLNQTLETLLAKIGIFRRGETRDRKEKLLHEMVEPEKALVLHHYLLDLVQKEDSRVGDSGGALRWSGSSPKRAAKSSSGHRIMAGSKRRVTSKAVAGKRVRRAGRR